MSGAKHGLCAWCFDLMALEGRDLRSRPLLERRIHLRHLLAKTDDERLLYSEEFDDPDQLLAAASRASLEGIVSKLADQPYRSGKNPGWIKVKTATWRERTGTGGRCLSEPSGDHLKTFNSMGPRCRQRGLY